jgi:mannose-6-phosphate isomerase-like protein (cupin superfamily)
MNTSMKTVYLISLFTISLFHNAMAQKSAETKKPAYVIELENNIARQQPGPHDGGGTTTGYSYFAKIFDTDFVFRKRALHPGSSIGYHEQDRDEIYYVLSGKGELTMNGETSTVGPGTAILTRPGSSHGLKQVGEEDLVIFIVYGKKP